MLEQSCAVLSKDESLQLNTRLEELDNFGSSIVDLLSQVFSSLLRKLEVLNSKVALYPASNAATFFRRTTKCSSRQCRSAKARFASTSVSNSS